MVSYPEFRRDRLATIISSRLYLAISLTLIAAVTWLVRPSAELWEYLFICLWVSITGVLYQVLVRGNRHGLVAGIFAPLDFALITLAVTMTGGAAGGLLILQVWPVITAGLILRPVMSIVFGLLSIAVTALSWLEDGAGGRGISGSFELFHCVGVAVVAVMTYVLVRQLDETLGQQQALRQALEQERDALDAEVARRTEELVQVNRILDNRNTLLAMERRQAEEANRLKSQFLANMSHELRTPLNAINGFADLMLQGIYGPVTAKQQERLGNIMSRARDLLHLINDVLDLARVEARRLELEYTEFDPSEVIEEVSRAVGPLLLNKGSDFALEVERPPAPFRVTCDRERYKQILLNLVSNALKFTEKGRVAIVLREGPDETFTTEVSDTGIGIRLEDLERIFEPFQQIDGGPTRRYGGMGLGLYLCRQLAALLHGTVQARSEVNVGSLFTVVLPRAVSAGPADQEPGALGGSGLEAVDLSTPGALAQRVSALEHRLQLAHQNLAALIRCSPVPMCLYAPGGFLLCWNRAFQALCPARIPRSAQTLQDALYADHPAIARELLELVSSGSICRLAWRGRSEDGNNRVCLGFHYPALDDRGGIQHVVCIMQECVGQELDDAVHVLPSPARGDASAGGVMPRSAPAGGTV